MRPADLAFAFEVLQVPERARIAKRLVALDLELAGRRPPAAERERLLQPWAEISDGGSLVAEMRAVVPGRGLPPVSLRTSRPSEEPGLHDWNFLIYSGDGRPARRELGSACAREGVVKYRRVVEEAARAAGWRPPLHPADFDAPLAEKFSWSERLRVEKLDEGRWRLVDAGGDARKGRKAWLESRSHAVWLVLSHETSPPPFAAIVYSLRAATRAAGLFLCAGELNSNHTASEDACDGSWMTREARALKTFDGGDDA